MKISLKAWLGVALAGLALGALSVVILPAPTGTPVCTEDMECWNCETMGNGICGPVSIVDGWAIDSHGQRIAVVQP